MINFPDVRPANTRPHGAYFWQLDRARTRSSKPAPQLVLALSMRVRDRTRCSRLYSHIRRIEELRGIQEARSYGSRLWQVDRARPSTKTKISNPMVGLSLHVWNRTRGRSVKPNDRNFGLLRLHYWRSRKETSNQTRSRLKQDVLGLGVYAAALQQSEQSCVPQLWWSRDHGLARLGDLREFRTRYGSDLPTRIDVGPPRCEWQLRGGQLCLGAALRTSKEQTTLFGVEAK